MALLITYYSIALLLLQLTLFINTQNVCTAGCLACTKLQRICTACDKGYELTSTGKCIKIMVNQNCSIFNNNNICIKCKPNYRLLNSSCVKDYSGCLQYEGNKCMSCGYGTILADGICVGILNCQ
jgi:hypothetical protein